VKKIGAIGDKLTLFYLELAGIKTVLEVHNPEEALNHIDVLAKTDDFGIIMISSQIYSKISHEINEIQERRQIPIITEIPEIKLKDSD